MYGNNRHKNATIVLFTKISKIKLSVFNTLVVQKIARQTTKITQQTGLRACSAFEKIKIKA